MRSATLDGRTFRATPATAGSEIVRIHEGDSADYAQAIIVDSSDDGKILYLSLWMGPPLTNRQWRTVRDALYPAARRVEFDRMEADGTVSHHMVKL